MVALVVKMEQLTQRFGINISAKKSEILHIGRGASDIKVEDVQLRGHIKESENCGRVHLPRKRNG